MTDDTGRTAVERPGSGMEGRVLDGTFQILELLGRGGMGEVYRARDLQLQRDVAVKMLSERDAADEAFVARFEREARAASAVSHANVAHIYSVGRHAGRPYYVMELIEGTSLADRLAEQGALSPDEGRDLLIQACRGLRAASEKGVVHRDLKPGNLMVDSSGTLKIVDFGLARRAELDQTVTQEGHTVGTPAYMAPEQALGKPVDHRADIYALGATFFELLSGRRPFEADTPLEVITKHLHEPPPPLRDRNPRVPPLDSLIIQKMLAKSPQTRYQSYDELLAALEGARQAVTMTGSHPVVPVVQTATARRTEARRPLPVAWIAVAVVGVLVAIVIGTSQLGRKPDAGPAAGETRQHATTPAPSRDATGETPPSPGRAVPVGEGGTSQLQPAMAPPTPFAQPFEPTASYEYVEPTPFDQPPKPAAFGGRDESGPPAAGQPDTMGARGESATSADPRASTVQILSQITAAVERFKARQGRLPTSLGEVRSLIDSSLPDRDAWGAPVHYQVEGADFSLASPGEDRVPRTSDDLLMRNGRLEQMPAGGPHPPPRPGRH